MQIVHLQCPEHKKPLSTCYLCKTARDLNEQIRDKGPIKAKEA